MDYSEFRKFCFMHSSADCHLPSGSAAELPMIYTGHNPTDTDALLYCYDICAIPWNRRPPKTFKGTVLRIDSDHTPPGFAKLQICERKCPGEPTYYRRPRMLRDARTGGPAITNVGKDHPTSAFRKKAPSYSDRVFAIYCPYWPDEADEWRVRKRNHGWPSERLINRIARGGCHFVSKLRTWSSTCDDAEWRFSFSKAEVILIHNWTDVQKKVYHLVRVIKKDIANQCDGDEQNAFQTYFFKTLMLWACEEKPSEYWNKNNVEMCVREILCRLVECLIELQCPSYFIPGQNIMSHLSQKNREKELQILVNYIENVSECIRNIASEFMSAKSSLVPNSVLGDFLWKSVGHAFPVKADFECHLKHRLSDCEWFLPEMSFLHRAVEANRRLMSIDGVSSRRESEYYSQCLENFSCAMTKYKWVEPLEQLDSNLSIFENTIELLRRMPARFARNESRLHKKPEVKAKCATHPTDSADENRGPLDFFSNAQRFKDAITKMLSLRSPYNSPESMELLSDAASQYIVEEYDAISLPVPLFGVVTAYEANFLYTCMQSYQLAHAKCEKYLKVYEDLKPGADDQMFAEVTPMLISTSLSPIYDEHVQTIFGFATLYKFCTTKDSDSVPIHEVVLPVTHREFVRYMDFQCTRKFLDSSIYFLSNITLPKSCDCLRHNLSQFPQRFFYSVIFFFAALRQSRANVRLYYSECCETE